MLFSEAHGIRRDPDDDWFDPILTRDTKLFVDPFLIFLDGDPSWVSAHGLVVGHFDRAFQLLAKSNNNPEHVMYKGAINLLGFPEPREFCLGYVAKGTQGSGSGALNAHALASAMRDAIARGVAHLEHFEEIGIFKEGIGPDRVSDIVCTILKPVFVEYTQQVARKHGVPLDRHQLRAAGFDERRNAAAQTRTLELPTNPATGDPVILVPERFLRELPVLNAGDWFCSTEASQLRAELNIEVMTKVPKSTIVAIAQRNPESVRQWVKRLESTQAIPYDLNTDPKGLYQWYSETRRFAGDHPLQLAPPETVEEFYRVIDQLIERFKHFVEDRRGWRLLWNDAGDEKGEEAVQLLFYGIVRSLCEANNINVDREVELGKGPVDFKFSNGHRWRALIEVKKLHNGRFWAGLDAQLPSYLKSEKCDRGWLLAVQYRSDGVSRTRLAKLPLRVKQLNDSIPATVSYQLVDARRKKSASKLNP